MIYEPREDSYLLQKYVRKYARGRVLDVGTGSGIQAKTAVETATEVLAIDINPEAVAHVQEHGIAAVQSDLFENVKGTFDLIIFNAPYLPEQEHEVPEVALQVAGGKEGHEIIERFLKGAATFLAKDGKILLVCSSLTPHISQLFTHYRWKYRLLEEETCFFEQIKAYLLERLQKSL